MWSSVVSVTLVEGKELSLDNNVGQLFVRFRLGELTYKSKVPVLIILFSPDLFLLSPSPYTHSLFSPFSLRNVYF